MPVLAGMWVSEPAQISAVAARAFLASAVSRGSTSDPLGRSERPSLYEHFSTTEGMDEQFQDEEKGQH